MEYSRAFKDAVNQITYLKGKYQEGQETGDQVLSDWADHEAEKHYSILAQESPRHADMLRGIGYDAAQLYNQQVQASSDAAQTSNNAHGRGTFSPEWLDSNPARVGMGEVKSAEQNRPYTLAERRQIDDAVERASPPKTADGGGLPTWPGNYRADEPRLEMPNPCLPGWGLKKRGDFGNISFEMQKVSAPKLEMPIPYGMYDNIRKGELTTKREKTDSGQENVIPLGSYSLKQNKTGDSIAAAYMAGPQTKTLNSMRQPGTSRNNSPVKYAYPYEHTIRYDLNQASFVNDLALTGNPWAIGMHDEQRLFVDTSSPGVFLSAEEVRQRGLDPATVRPINAPGTDELAWGRPVKSLAGLKQLSEGEILARVIYAEAYDTGDAGMEAVATSIINRSNDIRYKGANYNTKDPAFYSIVWAPNQYESIKYEYNDQKHGNKKAFIPNRNAPAWIKACDLALAMVTGQWQGITNPEIGEMTSFRSGPPKGKNYEPRGKNYFFYGV